MLMESHRLIGIIQYIVFSGLVISGAAVLFVKNFRKKMVFSFLLFLFLTILAFIFYSGTVFVITGSGYIFIFILIYLLTGSGSSGGKEAYSFSLNADKKYYYGYYTNFIIQRDRIYCI